MKRQFTPSPLHPLTLLLRLLRFALPLWPWVGLSVLLGVAAVGSGVALLGASAWIIATAALQPSIAVLQVAIVAVRFFGITRGLFRYLERLVSHEVTFRLLARFRVWFYARLEPLAPAVLDGHRTGDLLARIVADVGTLEGFYVRVIAPPLVALLAGVGLWAFFAGYDARLGLALLAFLAAAGAGVPLLVRLLSAAPGRALVTERAVLNAGLVDAVQGLPDLLAFGRDEAEFASIAALGRRLGGVQTRMAAIRGLHTALGSLLASLSVLAVLTLAIPLVRGARISGVDLAVLALVAAAAFEAVQPLPLAAQYLETSLAAARRLFDVIGDGGWGVGDGERPISQPPSPITHHPSPVLSVENLSFRYDPALPPVLDGLSFELSRGQCLGIVGPSGAGKSSLLQVLLRFRDYQEGRVSLFGRDLRSYAPDDARRLVAVVSQRTHLFNATVRDNLLLARPEASASDLEGVARAAGIHDFIASLPQGYDTWVGEGGARLSGGERQRLAIARALLKDAPLLLLDEATANLDPLTEVAVLAAIRDLMAGRSTLMITHRLAGLENASAILVLDRGRVIERGTHAFLLARDGAYRRMWDYQAQVSAVEALR